MSTLMFILIDKRRPLSIGVTGQKRLGSCLWGRGTLRATAAAFRRLVGLAVTLVGVPIVSRATSQASANRDPLIAVVA